MKCISKIFFVLAVWVVALAVFYPAEVQATGTIGRIDFAFPTRGSASLNRDYAETVLQYLVVELGCVGADESGVATGEPAEIYGYPSGTVSLMGDISNLYPDVGTVELDRAYSRHVLCENHPKGDSRVRDTGVAFEHNLMSVVNGLMRSGGLPPTQDTLNINVGFHQLGSGRDPVLNYYLGTFDFSEIDAQDDTDTCPTCPDAPSCPDTVCPSCPDTVCPVIPPTPPSATGCCLGNQCVLNAQTFAICEKTCGDIKDCATPEPVCPENKRWDGKKCECKNILTVVCDHGFNEETCMCNDGPVPEKITGQFVVQVPSSLSESEQMRLSTQRMVYLATLHNCTPTPADGTFYQRNAKFLTTINDMMAYSSIISASLECDNPVMHASIDDAQDTSGIIFNNHEVNPANPERNIIWKEGTKEYAGYIDWSAADIIPGQLSTLHEDFYYYAQFYLKGTGSIGETAARNAIQPLVDLYQCHRRDPFSDPLDDYWFRTDTSGGNYYVISEILNCIEDPRTHESELFEDELMVLGDGYTYRDDFFGDRYNLLWQHGSEGYYGSAGPIPGADECPGDDTKTEPGICGCGVADTDTDGDGTPNCNDGCPADDKKTTPGTCGCGVTDADHDQYCDDERDACHGIDQSNPGCAASEIFNIKTCKCEPRPPICILEPKNSRERARNKLNGCPPPPCSTPKSLLDNILGCVPPTPPPPPPPPPKGLEACVDPDAKGVQDPKYVKSTVQYGLKDKAGKWISPYPKEITDVCTDKYQLQEQSCDPLTKKAITQPEKCLNGCDNGACRQKPIIYESKPPVPPQTPTPPKPNPIPPKRR